MLARTAHPGRRQADTVEAGDVVPSTRGRPTLEQRGSVVFDRAVKDGRGCGTSPAIVGVADGSPSHRGAAALIDSQMPADAAIARALVISADVIAANVSGVVRDLDSKFLRDLRVAVRRTRSLLKLTGDVLPDGFAERYSPEFKWLADLTGPTRDLDVFLREIDDLAKGLTAGSRADLDAFVGHLRARRLVECRRLGRGLRSERLTDLLDRWRNDLNAVIESPRPQVGTARELARNRLRRAGSRVAHRATAITPASLDEDVHALRKRAKELRYLLTVFAPLCRPRVYRALVTDLKLIQDVSGRFQNGSVQVHALRDYAAKMAVHPDVSAPSLLVMDELATRIQQRQARTRGKLTYLLGPFAAEVPRRVADLVL